MERILSSIKNGFDLVPADCFGFDAMKVGPMKFKVERWTSGILGNVSHMDAKAPLGLMRLESLIIDSSASDIPLLSLDVMRVMGKVSVICEVYGTTLGSYDQTGLLAAKDRMSSYEDIPQKPHWYDDLKLDCCTYKACGRKEIGKLMELVGGFVAAYCDKAREIPAFEDSASVEAKKAKNNAYVDGLLTNGGPSTDIFLKSIGRERTSEFFHKVLF